MDAFNARDVEGFLGFMDPEIEWRSAVEKKTYRGHAGLVRYRADVDAILEEFHTEEDRFVDAGEDRVVHLYRIVGRGAGSGVPVDREVAAVHQLRNGKVVKAVAYLDQRQALEAAGLGR
jgi:ketosteroid isomerase-like protein